MKIALCNPPWIKNGISGVRAGSRWPHFQDDDYLPFPFFLAYAAAVLEEAGFSVYLIDAIAERMTESRFIKKLEKINPHLILFEISTPSLYNDMDISKKVRDLLGKDVKIALSGLHGGLSSREFLNRCWFVDFLLYGEYEYTLRDLAQNIDSPARTAGVIYRDKKGDIIKNPPRPLIGDLDSLPWPARGRLPMYRYNDRPGGIPAPSLQMWASRGCPYKCIFCAWPQIMYGSSSYRTRDPARVADEAEWCVKKYGFKSIYFDDDTFNIGAKRMLDISAEMKKRNIRVPWAVMARADTIDKDVLARMKEAGLYAVKFGVESGVQDIIDRAKKGLDLRKVEKSVLWCRDLGIKVHLTFMFGLPGETEYTIKKTIDFAVSLNPDSVQFSIATPFPGSFYYNMLKAEGKLTTEDWGRYDGAESAVIKTDSLSSRDLEAAVREAYAVWGKHSKRKKYLSAKYILKGLLHPVRGLRAARNIL